MKSREIWGVALSLTLGVLAAAVLAMQGWQLIPGQSHGEPGETPGNSPSGHAAASAPIPKRQRSRIELLPGFRAVTQEAGITFHARHLPREQGARFKVNPYLDGSGVAVGDYNGDGHDDLYFCNQWGPNALYRNDGRGRFVEVTDEAGPLRLDDRVSVSATWGDYDNDGDQDLYVTSTRGGNVLFNNDGQGRFRDVTEQAGLTLSAHSRRGVFFDFDNDGHLDLLVTNTARWTGRHDSDEGYFLGPDNIFASFQVSPPERDVLYRNQGDGTFMDVTNDRGLVGGGWSADAVVLDFDDDGWLDVLVTRMFGGTQLFRNERGLFRDVTTTALSVTSWGGAGAAALDFNNDGLLDLCVMDMQSDLWMFLAARAGDKATDGVRTRSAPITAGVDRGIARSLGLDDRRVIFGNTLYENLGGGRFAEVSERAGIETAWPWGVVVGDYDNDGHQDMFIASGLGFPFPYGRNHLLLNNSDGTFREESGHRNIEPRPGGDYQDSPIAGQPSPRSSRSAANFDMDGDGRLDLVVNNFHEEPNLYRNEFAEGNYVKLHLRGTHSNRDAIGAVVRLHVGDRVLTRLLNPASGFMAQSSKTLHFGVGRHEAVDRAEIRWPGGTAQVVANPAINQLHQITEPRRGGERL
jgi:hypothetical protein